MAATDDPRRPTPPPPGDASREARLNALRKATGPVEPGKRPPAAAIPTPQSGAVVTFAVEEHTDVIHLDSPNMARPRESERQFIVTVLSGPQTGLQRALDQPTVVVGRAPGCDFLLEDTALSRSHCLLGRSADGVFIEDLGSSNGTFVDGRLVQGRQRIEDGARIHLGRQTVLSLSRQDPLEQNAARQLYESAMRDPLTGVYNRRCLDQRSREELAYAQRHRSPLSLILLDLDHFKKVNDTYGHPAGDAVLRHLGDIIPRFLRKEDVAARYGGEEFAILARGIGVEGARVLAERLRKRIADAPVRFGQLTISITASVGVATMDAGKSYTDAAALLAAADEALYRAKGNGRNRTEDDRL
jgi:two-component system cell cycle response regulator